MQSEPLSLKASCDVRKSDSFSHIYYDNFSHLPVFIVLSWVFSSIQEVGRWSWEACLHEPARSGLSREQSA